MKPPESISTKSAFSLIEVTLALGILALALVSLVGLLIAAVDGAREVRLTHATSEVIATLSERLTHLDLDGDPITSPFEEIFPLVADNSALFYIFNQVDGDLIFTDEPGAVESVDQFLFAVRVKPSGVNPSALLEETDDGYTLAISDPDDYPEAYLALQVDLHSLPIPAPGTPFPGEELTEANFLVSYHTAILR